MNVCRLSTVKTLLVRMMSSGGDKSRSSRVFLPRFNALTGGMELHFVSEDYDYVQEIARSDYGDMLMDTERNQLYNKAIRKYVSRLLKKKSANEPIRVLDIGTGTGLLSMMVCREMGPDLSRLDLTAYECFSPVAECASNVVQTNGFEEKIKIINKRSDEDVFKPEERADLLVTEVFDTELIGEGAIKVFRWSLENQLTSNPLIIPHRARIWVQLISSTWLNKCHQLYPQIIDFDDAKFHLDFPIDLIECEGSDQLYDVQASALDMEKDIKLISHPAIAFSFKFTDINSLKCIEHVQLDLSIIDSANTKDLNIVFWWDIYMDDEKEYLLSCAPYWAHPLGLTREELPWRDHWMQAIYFLPANSKSVDLKAGDVLKLNCSHDEYSFWFNCDSTKKVTDIAPTCSCRIHQNLSRNRMLMLNNACINQKMLKALHKKLKGFKGQNILFLGDASLVPIFLAKCLHESNRIYSLKGEQFNNSGFFSSFAKANNIEDRLLLLDSLQDVFKMKFAAVISEPFFNQAILPWDNLHFWYVLDKLFENSVIDEKTLIYPTKARIKALPITFRHLHKTRAKLGFIEGFNMKDFDILIEKARKKTDVAIQPQSLWEYTGYALSDQVMSMFEWNLAGQRLFKSESQVKMKFKVDKLPENCIDIKNINLAFWMEFDFDDEVISRGPVEEIKRGEKVIWPKEKMQAVAFLYPEFQSSDLPIDIEYCLHHHHNDGILGIDYSIIKDFSK